MRAVVQRVSEAEVEVDGRCLGRIGPGCLVLLGVGREDTETAADWLAAKIANLRIFAADGDRMDRSLLEANGQILVVSQFTLYGDCRRGRRPDFTAAASPEEALPLYQRFCRVLREMGLTVAEGEFGAMMRVGLVNDGPVTLVVESPKNLQ